MRNPVIDNLRGICMLGVIAIHIGSLALAPNSFPLYVILEVLSRYSVPSFFFISGYGLFYQLKNKTGFSYLSFIRKRFQSVGVPYISWSLLYMLYFWLILPPGYISWNPLHVAFTLFFGLGCYHLYFMVILIWFYASLPLWQALISKIRLNNMLITLPLLFVFQLAFNYWTTHPNLDTGSWNIVLKNFFIYRLNYLPLHYLLIFICGGLAAIYSKQFLHIITQKFKWIVLLYLLSIVYVLNSCYVAFYYKNYTLIDLANTYHQLSPEGLIYTVTSLLFFCAVLNKLKPASLTYKAIDLLSGNSLIIYLIHPFILDLLTSFYTKFGIVMTVKKVSLSYFILVLASLAASILLTKLLAYQPTAAKLLTGKPIRK